MELDVAVAKMEGVVDAVKGDVTELKADVRDLRDGQRQMSADMQDIKFSLGSITAQLGQVGGSSTSSPALAKAETMFKWAARILVVIFVLGIGGGISINYEQINRILDTVSHAKDAASPLTSN